MSKQERAAWASLIVEGFITFYYFSALFSLSPEDEISGAGMAGLVAKVIVLAIILGIVTEIVMRQIIRQDADSVPDDERDKLITAKAYRNGYFILAIGVAGAIAQMVLPRRAGSEWTMAFLDPSAMYAAHLLLLSMIAASAVINGSRIFYYRRGY